MIGHHVVTMTPEGGAAVDLSCLCDEVSIHHGRDDTDSQPEAATATIDMSWDTDDTVAPAIEVGAGVTITTQLGVTVVVRFVGKVTDVSVGWDDAGEDTPSRPVAQVMCAALLADLGRRVVGDAPWPVELDGARVARVMAAAGVTLDPTFSDPGVVNVLARDVDSQPALVVAQEPAESARGIVWHTRSGEVRYADSEHRRGAVPALSLNACDVLVTPTWRRTTEGLVNDVSLGYGATPDGGEQPRVLASNAASIARFGRYEFTTATVLAALADAQSLAGLLLARNASPVWVMTALPVDLTHLSGDETAALLSLDMHSLIELRGLPVAGDVPTNALLWVEGWTERLAWGEHDIELAVSGYCRTAPPPRWDDMDPTLTWDDMGALTWDDMSCLGLIGGSGTWASVPASLRWSTVGAGVTWDTWNDYYG